MARRLVLIAVAGLALAGCDRLPSAPSAGVVASDGRTYLRGWVHDAVGRAVSDALVEMLDGPRAGARTFSDLSGNFEFTGGRSGRVTLRVSRAGFASVTVATAWSANPHERTRIMLKLLEPPLEILPGEYTLTLVSDPSATGWFDVTCAGFPPELLRRSYHAVLSPATQFEGFLVRFTSPSLIPLPGPIGFAFALTQAGQFFGFELELGFGSGPTEELSDHRYVTVSGSAPTSEPARVTEQSLIIPFSGAFEYCQLTSPLGGYNACSQVPVPQRIEHHACTSRNHLMVFTRR